MKQAPPAVAATETQRRATLIICCSALFMVSLDNTILNVALPSLQADMNAPVSGLQWTIDAYILVRGVMLFASGSTADRHGRRRMFRVGLLVFTLASLACSLAPDLGALIGFRCLQAVGGALMTPASLAIVTNTFVEPGERARAIGVWSATTGLSTAAGPILGGALVQSVGWRSVFWVNLPIGIAVLVATRWLRESRAAQARPLDGPGQVLLATTLATLIYALIDAPRGGWGSPTVVGLLVIAAATGCGFVLVELRRRHPMLPMHYFRNPGLIGSVVLALVAFIGLGGFIFFNTLYLQEVRGYSPLMAGLLTAPTTACTLVLSPLSGRITASHGARLPATLACALIAAAMLTLGLTIEATTAIGVLLVGYLLLGFGLGMINAPITNAAVAAMPRSAAGVASATTSTARQIGISLGVAMLGSVVFAVPHSAASPAHAIAFASGLSHAYLLVAALAAVAACLAFWAFAGQTREVEGA